MGSQSIADPGNWSPVGKKFSRIGIETDRFYDYFDRDYFKNKKFPWFVFRRVNTGKIMYQINFGEMK
ncbi:MAG: hypothetical protein Ct9H300mP4_04800 [Gammaproteobacteria bacterium]|nr:MAG: hypothetical protein Ct9H300mP4_04800 [Gammaproteobacteria bacterium]